MKTKKRRKPDPVDILEQVHAMTRRVLKPAGFLLVAVKAGSGEGYIDRLLEIKTQVYFSLFAEPEIAGFQMEFLERRNPYDFEIRSERIFAIGRKM